MDKVVHFEIPAKDMSRCQRFYEQVFGWNVNKVPNFGYAMVQTVKTDEKYMPEEKGAINGGLMQKKAPITHPIITINVENIDTAAKQIKQHGGKVILPKFKVGEAGYSAYFQDTEGNILGIWQQL